MYLRKSLPSAAQGNTESIWDYNMPLCDYGPKNVATLQCNTESRRHASFIVSSPTRLLAAGFTCENMLKTCFYHHQGLFRLTSLVSLSPVLLKVEFTHLRLFCTHRGASKLPRTSAQANRTNRPSEKMKRQAKTRKNMFVVKVKTYSKWAPMGPTLKIPDPNKLLETFNSDRDVLRAAICFYYPPCLLLKVRLSDLHVSSEWVSCCWRPCGLRLTKNVHLQSKSPYD